MKTAGMAARGDENMAAAGKEEDRHRASLWKRPKRASVDRAAETAGVAARVDERYGCVRLGKWDYGRP